MGSVGSGGLWGKSSEAMDMGPRSHRYGAVVWDVGLWGQWGGESGVQRWGGGAIGLQWGSNGGNAVAKGVEWGGQNGNGMGLKLGSEQGCNGVQWGAIGMQWGRNGAAVGL